MERVVIGASATISLWSPFLELADSPFSSEKVYEVFENFQRKSSREVYILSVLSFRLKHSFHSNGYFL